MRKTVPKQEANTTPEPTRAVLLKTPSATHWLAAASLQTELPFIGDLRL